MFERFTRILNWLQKTRRSLSRVFVLLTNSTTFQKRINRFTHILKIKTLLHLLQQLTVPQVTTQGTTMKITKNDLNSTTSTIWNNRTKSIIYQLTHNTIPILKTTITSISQRFLTQKPVIGTNLLLLLQLLQKRSIFIHSQNP